MNTTFLLYVVILMFFEISGQILFKKHYSATENKRLLLAAGILMYSISSFFVFKILGYGSLGVINVVWHVFHFTLICLLGMFVMGEKYTTKQLLACILGLISLVLFMTEEIE